MKKLIISIFLLFPLFLSAQETRVLNGQYNDGVSFGKPIHDTVRTLVATSPLSIVSGGNSLVDTIKSSGGGGGTPFGGDTYVQYDSAGYFSGNSGLTYDRTSQSLSVSQALQAGRVYSDTIFGQNGVSGNLTLIPTNTGATGEILFRSAGAYDITNNRLGIGTTSPSYDLDIVHSTNGVARAAITNSNTGTSTQAIYQAGNGTGSLQVGITGTNFTSSGLLTANTVYFTSTSNRLLFRVASTTAPIIFANGTDGNANTEIMRMFANGTVAIAQNTDSTSGKLIVGGTIVAGSNIIDATNNRIGINTKAPVHALDVQGASGNTIVGVGDNFGSAPLIYLQADATNGVVSFNSRRNYPFAILVNNVEYIRTITNGNTGFGLTSPTATIHIKAGTATAGTAPLKFTIGTNLTTPEAGAIEYNGTNLFFTPSSAIRNSVLMTASVNTVSPTSPDRTITVVINGTTLYIPAKTSND